MIVEGFIIAKELFTAVDEYLLQIVIHDFFRELLLDIDSTLIYVQKKLFEIRIIQVYIRQIINGHFFDRYAHSLFIFRFILNSSISFILDNQNLLDRTAIDKMKKL